MKVQVLKPFGLGGKEFLGGTVEIPENSVSRLLQKGLIALPDGSLPGDAEGSEEGAPAGVSPEVAHLQSKLEQQTRAFDAAWAEAQHEIDSLKATRDEALAHREQAVAENDKLKAELDALKADAEKAAVTADGKADAKGKAKS